MIEKIKRSFFAAEDVFFEWRSGLHFSGVIPHACLQTPSKYKEYATVYQAVWCRNLRKLILESRKSGFQARSFIDVGCGKGKACFYASRFGFEEVLGFDFDESLIEQARLNRARFRFESRNIHFFAADAAEWRLDEASGQSLLFLFNPFTEPVMERFILNNFDLLKKTRSALAYANDVFGETLKAIGMRVIYRDEIRKISLWRALVWLSSFFAEDAFLIMESELILGMGWI